jgi:hypothetical protein
MGLQLMKPVNGTRAHISIYYCVQFAIACQPDGDVSAHMRRRARSYPLGPFALKQVFHPGSQVHQSDCSARFSGPGSQGDEDVQPCSINATDSSEVKHHNPDSRLPQNRNSQDVCTAEHDSTGTLEDLHIPEVVDCQTQYHRSPREVGRDRRHTYLN